MIIFLLLGGGTIWYLMSNDGKAKKSTLTADRDFAVKDESKIHKIFIAKRTGDNYTLTRGTDHYWRVNDRYNVSPNVMKGLLQAITNVQMKYLPTQAAIPNIVKDLAARGIKVEIYDQSDKLLKAYYVGGIGVDGESTYFIMENSDQPIACEIPQMVGHVGTRYDFNGDEWRDKAIFEYEPEDIQSLSIEYPKQRNKSFKLERQGKGWDVKPFYDNVPPLQGEVKNGMVEGFLINFDRLVAENYENEYVKKDSIRNMIPFSVISVTDTKGEQWMAAFYPMNQKNTPSGLISRYFVDMNTGDWLLAQHLTFKKAFWSYQTFFDPSGQALRD